MGATHSTQHPYTLSTPIGKFNGTEQRDKQSGKSVLHRYLRVPFAQPPVGTLRWRRPQPLPADHIYDIDNTQFGPICPQPEYGHNDVNLDNPTAAPEPDNIQDEDCLYLNIWVPAASPPSGGWPVQVHLHGGWLQVGDACQTNSHDPYDLIAHTTPRIIVAPTYRLNLFGFLAGKDLADLGEEEAAGNYGFWDQRCALEWVAKNISHFGGNKSEICLGGLSAGANSTFFQLHYDSRLPENQRIIKRIYLWSNAVAIQPNPTTSTALTDQFNELCSTNDIDTTLPAQAKLSALRKIPSADLIASLKRLKMHTFRASTDNSFIPSTFLSSIHDGTFTTLLAQHGISVLLGEVRDEKNLYKFVNPPKTYEEVLLQLRNYYPAAVCDRLLTLYKLPDRETGSAEEWTEVFSQMVADMQIHASLRGFTHLLLNPPRREGVVALPMGRLHRYRICWRAECLDEWFVKEVGVTHSADTPIWWGSGWRAGYTEGDKEKVRAFSEPFGGFLEGREVRWERAGVDGGREERRVRVMDEEGVTREDVEDGLWERGLEVWDAVWDVQREGSKGP